MKTSLSILSVCFAVVCLAGSMVLINGLHSNRDLREANQKLQAELQAAQSKSDALLAEKQETTGQLAQLQSLSEDLKAQIAGVETARNNETDEPAPAPTPFPVQAFLGQKLLGQAWFVPRNPRKDPNTQRYVFEPVVWLDESLRSSFTTHHTNVVEREVETQTYNSIAYYPQPVYYYTYPFYNRPGTNFGLKPTPHSPPTQRMPPSTPFGGAVASRQTAMPASQIKTRSQQLGIPAQSIKPLPMPDDGRRLVP